MKILLFFTLIASLALTVFAQTEPEKEVRLTSGKMKKRILKQEFSDVPQSVRDCHATGTLRFYVKVDQDGKVKSVNLVSGLCKAANEYTEKAITSWKFKPLKFEEKKVSFRGVIEIPFCYGGFGSCY